MPLHPYVILLRSSVNRETSQMTRLLFTTLPTDDLGLLTRSLPIARELAEHGHQVVFCSPAKAPSRLIAEEIRRRPVRSLVK